MDRIQLKLEMEAETNTASDRDNGTRTDVSEEYVRWIENKLSKLSLDAVSDAVCSCVPDKMEEIGWYQKRHCNRCHKQTD